MSNTTEKSKPQRRNMDSSYSSTVAEQFVDICVRVPQAWENWTTVTGWNWFLLVGHVSRLETHPICWLFLSKFELWSSLGWVERIKFFGHQFCCGSKFTHMSTQNSQDLFTIRIHLPLPATGEILCSDIGFEFAGCSGTELNWHLGDDSIRAQKNHPNWTVVFCKSFNSHATQSVLVWRISRWLWIGRRNS